MGSTKCDIVRQEGGRILNFVTSHLKNGIKTNFVNLRLFNKCNCKICDVTLGRGGLRNVIICDKDGGGVTIS